MALSAIKIKGAKPKEKSYKLFDSGGLYLEVMPIEILKAQKDELHAQQRTWLFRSNIAFAALHRMHVAMSVARS